MQLYLASSATAHDVLQVIKEPEVLLPFQETTFSFLQFVITCEVRHFLRYATGSSALVVDETRVTNGLTGLACRPIAHTTTSLLFHVS